MKKSKYISIAILLFAYVSGICAGATITVGPDAGQFDYTSIQAAIDDADNGDQIEVSPGTYHEAINFLGKAVRLYSSGGPEVTIIDGTGHYHVVQCFSNEGPDTILEGFTITGGNARDAVWPYNCGGGMHNRVSSPSVIHCIFSGNTAKYGGGMYNHRSSPTVIDSTFVANSAADSGGAMGNHQSNPIIARCVFTGNTVGQHGGGIYNDVSSPTITDCMFSGNYAPFGGGMSNLGSRASVVNCTFIDNRGLRGGGMNNGGGGSIDGASPTVINSTFTGNSASNFGGAIGNAFGGKPTIINSILWGNTAPADPEIYIASDSSPTFTYCAVQGDSLWPGTGNINADPLFVDASAGDLRLSFGSPCIDAGSNAAVPAGITTDPDGNDRILDGTLDGTPTVDMGAYEFDVSVFPFNVTQGQFYPTIQAAIDDADADDEIVVSSGTYHEAINFLGKAVRLYSSDGPEVTIIDGSQPTVLLQEDFDDGNYNGWTIIDQGTNSAPSNWVVEGEQLVQKSNIHGIPLSDPKMLGTFALWNDAAAMAWTDLAMTVTMRSTDDDAMGVMFRYQDEHNYYRFAWLNQNHNQGVGRRQLSRMQNGELTVLAHNDVPYTVSQSYAVKIVTSGANLQVLVNGLSVLTATDSTFTDGSVALFCWGNQNTYFDNIEVVLPIYHVVQCVSGEGPDTILEGFTLTGGNADGPADTDRRGGGMYNLQSSPTVINCIFRHNTATDGGGMYNSASRPTITHSSFLNNSAKVTGGGIYNRDQSHLTITHSTFIGNYAVGGGGAMVNTIITHPKMTNCVFIGNTTHSRGGAIYNYFHSNPTITNCTFSRNTADDAGGGIYNDHNCTPTVANSILWGNSPDSFLNVNSIPNVTYSNIQGDSLWPGDGNINAAPLFVDAANGNLRLGQGSPCIDAGNNDAVPTGITTDLNGWSRFIDAPCTTDTGSGTGAVVDMGAYEFMPDFHPYLVWLTQHGLEEGPATAPGASVLHDGIPNLLKYAANVSPLQRLPAEFLPTMTIVEVEGLKFLGLTVRLHPGIGDVIWAVQESSDLKQWIATSQEYAAPTDHPDGTRSWHLRSLSQLLDGPVFLRLSLELVE